MAGVKFTNQAARKVHETVQTVLNKPVDARQKQRARSLNIPFVKMKVITVEDDYLTCKRVRAIDGTTITTDDAIINVAKPWELRQTYLHNTTNNGITYDYTDGTERNADDGSDDEDQVIVPAYDIHTDVIINCFQVYTGVIIDDNPVMWEDLNTAGRAWALDNG